MAELIIIILPALVGGFTQGLIGFGAAIVAMTFYPMIVPIVTGASYCQVASFFLTFTLAITFRKHINYRLFIASIIAFWPTYLLALQVATGFENSLLKRFLGIVLIILSIYFIRISGRIKLEAGILPGAICGALSGLLDSLFGIGGPPMVLYLLSVSKTKEEYVATTQAFFALSAASGVTFRIINGVLTPDMLPFALLVAASMVAGSRIGIIFSKNLNQEKLKKIAYVFIGVMGVLTLVRG